MKVGLLMGALASIRFDKEAVSVTFSFVANLLVRFNKLVSDETELELELALIRFDKETVSVAFNFVANLLARFKTEVSVFEAYNA
jgi:hypothetical protein